MQQVVSWSSTVWKVDSFKEIYTQWKNGEITATKGIELTGLKRNKFYDFIKEMENNAITI